MTDLEMIKKCAEKMGVGVWSADGNEDRHYWRILNSRSGGNQPYYPLENDAQAMALVKKFNLHIGRWNTGWACELDGKWVSAQDDLNRAIVECVAGLP